MADIIVTGHGALSGRRLVRGGYVYAGVPFAAPPVRGLRFQPPKPAIPWTGVHSSEYSAQPLQTANFHDRVALGSEDCLYLNIWTPDPGGNCPVVHWLFGGGCERGSASPPYSDGEELMRGANVVVVTSNYRLGALGFLHLGQSAEERWKHAVSVGRLDQVAALDWIQNNIGLFGGDPRNITVAGESAAPSR